MTARDPRARRAEAIRARVLELLEAERGRSTMADFRYAPGLSARSLRSAMIDSIPGKPPTQGEVTAALGVLRRQGKVRYRDRQWELAS